MTKYKTKDGSDVIIPNVGVTVDGFIETDQIIESPILEVVAETQAQPAPIAQAQPAQIPVETPGAAPAQPTNQEQK
jgi:hypothetical protein